MLVAVFVFLLALHAVMAGCTAGPPARTARAQGTPSPSGLSLSGDTDDLAGPSVRSSGYNGSGVGFNEPSGGFNGPSGGFNGPSGVYTGPVNVSSGHGNAVGFTHTGDMSGSYLGFERPGIEGLSGPQGPQSLPRLIDQHTLLPAYRRSHKRQFYANETPDIAGYTYPHPGLVGVNSDITAAGYVEPDESHNEYPPAYSTVDRSSGYSSGVERTSSGKSHSSSSVVSAEVHRTGSYLDLQNHDTVDGSVSRQMVHQAPVALPNHQIGSPPQMEHKPLRPTHLVASDPRGSRPDGSKCHQRDDVNLQAPLATPENVDLPPYVTSSPLASRKEFSDSRNSSVAPLESDL